MLIITMRDDTDQVWLEIREKCALKTIDIIIWFQETHWATVTEQWPLK